MRRVSLWKMAQALTRRQDGDGRQADREVCRRDPGTMASHSSRRLLRADGRTNKNDFERRMVILLQSLEDTSRSWQAAPSPTNYPDAMAVLGQFAEYKKTSKRSWVKERQELAALYSNIQTKIRTYGLAAWEPREGLKLEDLEVRWAEFLRAEGTRSRAINARIRE